MAVVNPGQYIRASDINSKADSESLVIMGRATDQKIQETKDYTIFVGTDSQWAALPVSERNKYLMRGVPK